jgi:HNH endonuclease/NUMOD3 motif
MEEAKIILENVIQISAPVGYVLTTPCWRWQKGHFSDGYGGWKGKKAHRLSYEIFIGPIPKKFLVLHKCDVRNCVNPDHLFIGRPSDNSADMRVKGRQAKGEKCRTYGKGYLVAGCNNGRYNLPVSLETRHKISEAKKGQIPWNKGKKGIIKFSLETRRKMSLARKPGSEEAKIRTAKAREAHIRKAAERRALVNGGDKSP